MLDIQLRPEKYLTAEDVGYLVGRDERLVQQMYRAVIAICYDCTPLPLCRCIRFDGCTPWTMRDTIKSTPGGNRGVENLSAPLAFGLAGFLVPEAERRPRAQ